MIKLKQAVIVEGKYDKIKLGSILDAVIITTDGFGIFKDKEKTELIRSLAQTCGVIILTDSDSAGFKIRNHIKGCVKDGKVVNVFIPEITGKEKRKEKPSAEGLLGVEGVSREVLEKALNDAGIIAESCDKKAGFLLKINFSTRKTAFFDKKLVYLLKNSVVFLYKITLYNRE